MKRLLGSGLIFLTLSISGCAAMFHGTSEQVSINSNDPATELYVNGAYVGRGHAITSFKKRDNYVISARKSGCTEHFQPVNKSFDAITLLGFFVDWGLVSILVVDGAATGAWQHFDQTSYIINPNCSAANVSQLATPN